MVLATYEIMIREEMNEYLKKIAASAEVTVQEIVQDLIDAKLEEEKVSMIIKLYKDGKLKAREAWKLTGLSYQEFQTRATG